MAGVFASLLVELAAVKLRPLHFHVTKRRHGGLPLRLATVLWVEDLTALLFAFV